MRDSLAADSGRRRAEISAHKKHKQRERHQSHNFKEGWVEFLDKRVARSVAEMLNAQTIGASGVSSGSGGDSLAVARAAAGGPGQLTNPRTPSAGGKKSDRWHDDVWTMKYLPRFRWDQLSEQVGASACFRVFFSARVG